MIRNEPNSTPDSQDSRNLLSDDLQREVDAAAEYGLSPPIEVEALAEQGQTVHGAIIAHEDDQRIRRALAMTPTSDSTATKSASNS